MKKIKNNHENYKRKALMTEKERIEHFEKEKKDLNFKLQ